MKTFILCLIFLISIFPQQSCSQGLSLEEQVFDFGHIGIDFKVHHTFTFVNPFDTPLNILDLDVTCDCSTVSLADSIIQPGDTARFNLIFETKDYLGPTNKSFRALTDNPKVPTLEYFYISVVGQWYNGVKPNPVSLFFLPGKKEQSIRIPNKEFNNLSISKIVSNNDNVDFSYPDNNAKKDKDLIVTVSPSEKLTGGTFYSTITIFLDAEGADETRLTIPVKIVKY